MAPILPLSSRAQTATKEIDCGQGQIIGEALPSLNPGDTLLVSGVCEEHVAIGTGFYDITLDGQGTATIIGPDPTRDVISIRGRGITITGFTITGGRDGVALIGAPVARIDNNIIESTRKGFRVHQFSFAFITNNTIANNREEGILVFESSSARIGFTVAGTAPNLIEGNGLDGISVSHSSNARIEGNVIRENRRNGVNVGRVSHADIASNTIEGNLINGINVTQNSGVNLGSDTGEDRPSLPNSTTVPNKGFGIQGSMGAYADGRMGTLTGDRGAADFDETSINSLLTE